MKCYKCNSDVDQNASFCPVCGTRLHAEHLQQMEDTESDIVVQKKKPLIVGIILFALCMILLGVILLFGIAIAKKNKENTNSETKKVLISGESNRESSETETQYDPEEIKATLLMEQPVFDEEIYRKVNVISANASSTIEQEDFMNDPMVMFDGLPETSWQEGVDGYGIGEYADCQFDETYKVKYICFRLGNWRIQDMFEKNTTPRELSITMGDYSESIVFRKMDSTPEDQWVELSAPVSADSIRVTIEDVWTGSLYDDTCIAEIIIYGEKK